jgi:hypothetical protein
MQIYDPVAFEAADVAACMPMIISATCLTIVSTAWLAMSQEFPQVGVDRCSSTAT